MRAHGYTMSMHSRGPRSINKVALYYYTLKSEEDFRAKVHRGGGDGKHKVANFIAMVDACAPHSPTLRLLAMYRRRH